MGEVITKTTEYLLQQISNFAATKSLISQEVTGLYGTEVLKDMNHIIQLYGVYEQGAAFTPEGNGDTTPSTLRYKKIRGLINKEARFLFSVPPDFQFKSPDKDKKKVAELQEFLNAVLEANVFDSKLVKAARDCFIGKRIAITENFNKNGITIAVIPALEFVYETDPDNVDRITKFIQYYNTVVNEATDQQRIYKKKWWVEKNGSVWFNEGIYNGMGVLIEQLTADSLSKLKKIPVQIIVNDGLSGDVFGVSDVETLDEDESYYSKLANKDMDSIRKGSDQIVWAMDVNPATTKGLKRSPGAFWDLQSDLTVSEDGGQGKVGTLENDMSYSTALDLTLNRLKADMYDHLDMPDVSPEALKGVVSSGKTLKAIYWGLIVRCNEKMLVWRPALKEMVKTIIEGAKVYPESAKPYNAKNISVEYTIDVENSYPIPDDENEEKATDLLEVQQKTLSRKSYMKKWYNYTDDECDEEIDQLMMEKQLLEGDMMGADYGSDMAETGAGKEPGKTAPAGTEPKAEVTV